MDLTNAPSSKDSILTLEELESHLQPLVGSHIEITRKARTDGANIRKLVSSILADRIKNALAETEYEILPPKGKGIPRLLLELLDTYVVTTGDSYNLQVWNRMPNSSSPLIRYNNGETISSQDIRLVFVKVDIEQKIIDSIIILTPQYVEKKFGVFGKPTIKQQLLVSNKQRSNIVNSDSHIYYSTDTSNLKPYLSDGYKTPGHSSETEPQKKEIYPIEVIYSKVAKALIGNKLNASDTKTRGQLFERMVIELLGYSNNSKLVGGYPDIPHQLLEVKVQDTQTIDLGKYSPQFKEIINNSLSLTTKDVRYLIALTNAQNLSVEGLILCSGQSLGNVFTYVSDKSYKCQRSIPMDFFNKYKGRCISNPEN